MPLVRLRSCTRVETDYPVIFAGESFVGEGIVTNMSVPGCRVRSQKPVELGSYLEMRVLTPGGSAPVTVGLAKVRWQSGSQFGVEFIRVPGEDQIRLGRLVRQGGSGIS